MPKINTCMSPFTRQTLCFNSTICESWGCIDRSSSLTDSILALCSVDSWIAVTSLVALSARPNTTRESPTFAICRSPLHIIPTKQHDPAEAICGLLSHCFFTRERKLSSVAEKAFFITFSDMSWCSVAYPASQKKRKKKYITCSSIDKINWIIFGTKTSNY